MAAAGLVRGTGLRDRVLRHAGGSWLASGMMRRDQRRDSLWITGWRHRRIAGQPRHGWTANARHSIHAANRSSERREPNMTDTPAYTPPDVWVWEKNDSPNWRYSGTNRPIAGATHEKALPRGKH